MRYLNLAAVILPLSAVSALAQTAAPKCALPVSQVTANEVIAKLQCRLTILDQERMETADRETMARSDLAMTDAELAKTKADAAVVQGRFDQTQAYWKRWCGKTRGCEVMPPRPKRNRKRAAMAFRWPHNWVP